jgi:hypothetical protein
MFLGVKNCRCVFNFSLRTPYHVPHGSLTCQRSPQRQSANLSRRFCQLFLRFRQCDLLRGGPHTHNFNRSFSTSEARNQSNVCVLPIVLSPKTVFSIPCLSDAVFANLEQNFMHMHCNICALLGCYAA